MAGKKRVRLLRTTAAAAALLLLLAACGGDEATEEPGEPDGEAAEAAETDETTEEGGETSAGGPSEFSVLTHVESSIVRDELTRLAEDQCAAENEALPLDLATVPQADVTQRVTLLASQGALPVMFVAPTAGVQPGGDLEELTLDYEDVLGELGVLDNLLPAAQSTIQLAYGGRMASLPFQYNIEGFWYNHDIFADLGIDEPETWDELLAAAETLDEAGIQPLTVAGSQGWTITRYISGYLFRDLGRDAMERIRDGEARLTDPEYVRAAEAIASLGEAGYFGEGVTSRDIDTAYAQFLNGEAGMMYMGTWFLANIHDEDQNAIGEDAIGFMPFPTVEGGQGDRNNFPANAGTATALSSEHYSPLVGDWLACIADHYGSSVLANQNVVSGFELNTPVEDVPPLTAEIQETVANAEESVLWFETLFQPRANQASLENAALLITGGMSPEDFMDTVQRAIDEES